MEKLPKPTELSFYLINDSVYYNQTGAGLDHPDLWKKVVMKVFTKLNYEDRIELCTHCYGVDRGRVVYIKEDDSWAIYGTPGCEDHKIQLIEHFHLDKVNLIIDFKTDIHYRTRENQVKQVQSCAKLVGVNVLSAKVINHFIQIP
jgi:hypothetical protein